MSKSEKEIKPESDELKRFTWKLDRLVNVYHLYQALQRLPAGYQVSVHAYSSVEIRVDHENQTISLVGF